jgi:hypothetical protein
MSVSFQAIARKVAEYSTLGRWGTADASGDTTTLIDAMIASYADDVPEGEIVYEVRPKLATVTTTGTIAFVEGSPDTITESGSLLGEFAVGDIVEVSGSDKNDGLYTLATVASGTLTVGAADLVTETADSTRTISLRGRGHSAWATDFAKATGTITVSPAKGEAWAEGDEYELWNRVVGTRARVVRAVGRALTERCSYTARVPLGMLADGDCQAITNWTVNASATRAVAALAFPYRFGQRYYLAVTSSDGSDYVYQRLAVTPAKTYEIAVLMRVPGATTGSVTIHDMADSNATITPSGDTISITGQQSAGSDWESFRASFATPSGCDGIEVRLKNGSAAATHLAYVLIWAQEARSLPIPDRVVSEKRVGRVFRLKDRADPALPESWQRIEDLDTWPESGGYGGLQMGFNFALGSKGPYRYEEKTFYEWLYSDADTTNCDLEWAAREATLELASEIAARLTVAPGSEEVRNWKELELRALYNVGRVRRGIVPDGGIIVRRARR